MTITSSSGPILFIHYKNKFNLIKLVFIVGLEKYPAYANQGFCAVHQLAPFLQQQINLLKQLCCIVYSVTIPFACDSAVTRFLILWNYSVFCLRPSFGIKKRLENMTQKVDLSPSSDKGGNTYCVESIRKS